MIDLRSGLSWWLDRNPRFVDFPPLPGNTEVDVAILGAGVTGALLAYELVGRGLSVSILDAGDVARGSTAASTALLMAETDAEFRELVERFGLAAARRVWELGAEAIEWIAELCPDLPLDPSFERLDSLYLASDRRAARGLELEANLRHVAGLEFDFLDRRAIRRRSSFPHRAGLLTRGAALDPYRLTMGALIAAHRHGALVHDRTRVKSFRERADCVRLTTDRGARVDARRLVIAAGYAGESLLGMDLGRLRTSYALVTEPMPEPIVGWPEATMVWETARPYLYARPLPGGRLLAGGADTPFARDHRAEGRLRRRTQRVARSLARLVPKASIEVAVSWAGTFGESRDALPWIGRVPGRERTFAALGFGGNGITFSAIAARLLAEELCGGCAGDLRLFSFDR